MTKSQTSFAIEYARQLLVRWADQTLRDVPLTVHGEEEIYLAIARDKKWVGKREPARVTASGFTAAAGFLKR